LKPVAEGDQGLGFGEALFKLLNTPGVVCSLGFQDANFRAEVLGVVIILKDGLYA